MSRPTYEHLSAENQVPVELEYRRLLTEVAHLTEAMDADGFVPVAVLADVRTNLETAVCEIAIPSAVTTTLHQVEFREDAETLAPQRVITWLGHTAVENAANGRLYHFSEPALARVAVEEAEAQHAEGQLRPGIAQIFVSPKMSAADASKEIAEAEHLAAEDSIRVSYAVTDAQGQVVARKLQSLLVESVPLSAWYAWLKDGDNMFGRAFSFADETSALPIMELFAELEVPEELLPNGPVDIVAAVLPYVTEPEARSDVSEQLERFRGDQRQYAEQARETAAEWLAFDIELAKSLRAEQATFPVRRFIVQLQHQWNDTALEVITRHASDDAHYVMTEELAALLEKAKQNLLGGQAAVATGNHKVLAQVGVATARQLQTDLQFLAQLKAAGAPRSELQRLQVQIDRRFAAKNLKIGGGCMGKNGNNFGDIDPVEGASAAKGEQSDADPEDKANWKWKRGVCRVKACPTRPGETRVGPCEVCDHCQKRFDRGEDPTTELATAAEKPSMATILAGTIGRSAVKLAA